MKIQCSCGAKYAVDITPEMGRRPVQFVCQLCGVDSSAMVNELIRRELEIAAPPAPVGIAVAAPAPVAVAAPTAPAIRSRVQVAQNAPAAAEPAIASEPCPKHPSQLAEHRCLVCQKLMCRKCMEIFGYVCSPFCKSKAAAKGMRVPVYAGQRSVVEAQLWSKVGKVVGIVGAVAAVVIGVWTWYVWFGSRPKVAFAMSYEPVETGNALILGKDQILVLHGDTLSRYDMKSKKEVWSQHLVDMALVDKEVADYLKSMEAVVARANLEAWENTPKVPSKEKLRTDIARSAAAALQLYVQGSNLWVSEQRKLVRHDWDTGKSLQEIPETSSYARVTRVGNELVLREENNVGDLTITHVDLATSESHVEKIINPAATALASGKSSGGKVSGGKTSGGKGSGQLAMAGNGGAGLPVGTPGADSSRTMDPARVAEEASRLSYPAKIALPAVLANSYNQERTLNELNDGSRPKPVPGKPQRPRDEFSVIPSKYGNVQFSVELLQENFVTKKAMKDPPKKSALDGEVNVTQSTQVANEILNEMQRDRGGATITVDESRYLATVRSPDGKLPDWSGEVVGRPHVYPLKSVNIIAAGTTLIILDKANKKMWQNSLTHAVKGGGFGGMDEDFEMYGQGPFVERGERLYVFDEAVLTAFNLSNGSAYWRLPSVGVAGLFFDDKGMMYVNTTTEGIEGLKYAQQIDITRNVNEVVLKVDPANGKILWSTQPGGHISYLSGKFIYVWSSNDADDEVDSPLRLGLETPSYIRIKRLNPSSGKIMWEHYQKRAPLDVKFNGNVIQLVFKKEVQVLKYLSF